MSSTSNSGLMGDTVDTTEEETPDSMVSEADVCTQCAGAALLRFATPPPCAFCSCTSCQYTTSSSATTSYMSTWPLCCAMACSSAHTPSTSSAVRNGASAATRLRSAASDTSPACAASHRSIVCVSVRANERRERERERERMRGEAQ
jgi:hypothetical protein